MTTWPPFAVRRPGTDAARAPDRVARAALASVAAVAGVVALIVSRRPDGIWNPQFWAEDGTLWYAQAYNEGALHALATPAAGYLQTFSRLTAALSLPFALRHAPLVFELAAILVQALPPLYVLSDRFSETMPDLRVRLIAALLLIGAPNGFEVQSNVTNAQTHLALLALLIVLAAPPRGPVAAAGDILLLLLAGLSSPTCVLLFPVAVLSWWYRRTPWRAAVAATVLVPATVQTLTYLTSGGAGRESTPLGASGALLLRIVGGQIFTAGIVGAKPYSFALRHGGAWTPTVMVLIALIGLLLVARALWWSGSLELRLCTLFGALALAAGLTSPTIKATARWEALCVPNAGGRYYAPAILAVLALLLWSACADPSRSLRRMSRALLATVLLVGMPLDWWVAPRPDLDFARHAELFAIAPPGAVVQIPIPPRGWRMTLHKH
jgi:hypothetical protein